MFVVTLKIIILVSHRYNKISGLRNVLEGPYACGALEM